MSLQKILPHILDMGRRVGYYSSFTMFLDLSLYILSQQTIINDHPNDNQVAKSCALAFNSHT